MKISDLFTDPTDNRLSHTKIWNHIGLLCMTIMFCWYSYHFKIDEWLLFAYGFLVTHQNLLGKFLSFRFGANMSQNNLPVNQKEKEEQ